ncbi:hypothetical protein FOA52_001193 [Chlamydomonas sp. UWO 241]|nr:hypothetical protein FOA52_001193 [Chlamydomonas sp. UWO 241]
MAVSEPRKCLVGEGKNAKYVKDCTEVFLGNKGIEKIRGFEEFVNLESLWLNGNKLKKINNLDLNFRIKVLNAQDNQICTLKGSLPAFHQLEQLDLSANCLRDLSKLLPVLQRFQFLTHLDLSGNPCCEEPDYRLQVVHAMPGLRVLDQHVIMAPERLKARAAIGGDVASLTVAFGTRAPVPDGVWDRKVPERSLLERELVAAAGTCRDAKILREQNRELQQFSHNPHPDIPRGNSLPPNAGTMRTSRGGRDATSTASATGGATTSAFATAGSGTGKTAAAVAPAPHVAPYVARGDTFSMYTASVRSTGLLSSGCSLTRPAAGGIGLEQRKYEAFVARKAEGTLGQWKLGVETVAL